MECPICMLAINTWALSLLRDASFKGTSSHHFLFAITLIQILIMLQETDIGQCLERKDPEVNHSLVIDDLKLFAKTESQIDSLLQTICICYKDIGMCCVDIRKKERGEKIVGLTFQQELHK